MDLRGGGTDSSSSHSGREPLAHWARSWRSTKWRLWDLANSRAGLEKRSLVSMTKTLPPCT